MHVKPSLAEPLKKLNDSLAKFGLISLVKYSFGDRGWHRDAGTL